MNYLNNRFDGLKPRKRKNNIYHNGTFYDNENKILASGKFKNYKLHGLGILYENSEKYLEGKFIDGIFQCNYGKEYKNGNLYYEGSFKNNKKHGKGKLFVDNQICDCSYNNDNLNGKFTSYMKINNNLQKIYTLHYKNNVKQGIYEQFYENGNRYITTVYKNNIQRGKGILYHDNGNIKYDGNLKNFKFNGIGTLYNINRQIIYTGNFKNNFFNGYGIFYYNNGNVKYDGIFFNGNFQNGVEYKEDGSLIDSNNTRQKHRDEMNIRNFLETNNTKKIQEISTDVLIEFAQTTYSITICPNTPRDEILNQMKQTFQNNKLNLIKNQDNNENFDTFGNEIIVPCIGSDDAIYDISSMEYLFFRNEVGDYVNIRYIYDENNKSIPNFPLMNNGKILNSYFCPTFDLS